MKILASRAPKNTSQIEKHGVKSVEFMPELIGPLDAITPETNDGRPHDEQTLPVLLGGKKFEPQPILEKARAVAKRVLIPQFGT